MTDYTKLIERLRAYIGPEVTPCDEAADAIEALQSKLGDAIQSSAHWQHQFTEAQAENDLLKGYRDRALELATAYNNAQENIAQINAHREHILAVNEKLTDQVDAMGKGEPVAQGDPVPLYRAAINCPHEIDHEQVILKYDPKQPGHNALNQLGRRLVAAVAAPKAMAPLTDEQMRDAFAQALTGVYVCTRVWSAWSYGTMTEDDFSPASECDEVLDSLVQAAHEIGGTP